MREAQKQKILGFIDGIHQMHESIKGALKRKNFIFL